MRSSISLTLGYWWHSQICDSIHEPLMSTIEIYVLRFHEPLMSTIEIYVLLLHLVYWYWLLHHHPYTKFHILQYGVGYTYLTISAQAYIRRALRIVYILLMFEITTSLVTFTFLLNSRVYCYIICIEIITNYSKWTLFTRFYRAFEYGRR